MYSPLRHQRAKAELHSPRLPARSRFGEGREGIEKCTNSMQLTLCFLCVLSDLCGESIAVFLNPRSPAVQMR